MTEGQSPGCRTQGLCLVPMQSDVALKTQMIFIPSVNNNRNIENHV